MKKFLAIALILLMVLAGCGKKNPDISKVTLEEVKTKLDNKESFVFVLGQDTCSACQIYKPVLKEVVTNKDTPIYYHEIVSSTMNEEKAKELTTYFQENFGDSAQQTPTTYVVVEGKTTKIEHGTLGYRQLLTILRDNGLVE